MDGKFSFILAGSSKSALPPSLREVPRRGGGSVLSRRYTPPVTAYGGASPLKEGAKALFPLLS